MIPLPTITTSAVSGRSSVVLWPSSASEGWECQKELDEFGVGRPDGVFISLRAGPGGGGEGGDAMLEGGGGGRLMLGRTRGRMLGMRRGMRRGSRRGSRRAMPWGGVSGLYKMLVTLV